MNHDIGYIHHACHVVRDMEQALSAFVAYTVAVRDLGSTRRWLEHNNLDVHAVPAGGIFVPAKAALDAAVIFRQAY